MKTYNEQIIKEKVAKHLNEPVNRIIIEDAEIRENYKGIRLTDGRPVYCLMNTGVDGEEVAEFCGWVINGRWYKENVG